MLCVECPENEVHNSFVVQYVSETWLHFHTLSSQTLNELSIKLVSRCESTIQVLEVLTAYYKFCLSPGTKYHVVKENMSLI